MQEETSLTKVIGHSVFTLSFFFTLTLILVF